MRLGRAGKQGQKVTERLGNYIKKGFKFIIRLKGFRFIYQ